MSRFTKICLVCGKAFYASPSSKTVTCSKSCSIIRKAQTHKGKSNVWSDNARAQYRKNEAHVRQAKQQVVDATRAAMSLPESQKGPQHRECKVWILKAPDGTIHRAVGLLPWIRENYLLFEPDTNDPNAAIRRIKAGFSAIAGSMFYSAPSRKRNPVTSYKGWQLLSVSDKTHDEKINALIEYHNKKSE